MKRLKIATLCVAILIACVSYAMTDDLTTAVQKAPEKEANGQQLTPEEMDTQWGPDGFGYEARDQWSGGPMFQWYDNTATGTEFWAMQMVENDWYEWVSLPFDFPFYDSTFNQISISADMIIRFTSGSVPNMISIPFIAYPYRIDPYCYDMYHVGGISHYYYQAYSDTMFSISFHDARYSHPTYRLDPAYSKTLQVLLFADGRIRFQYDNMLASIPGTPFPSGIDDNAGPYGLSCGNSFPPIYAITFYPPPVYVT